jgi:hypothetical protein
MVVMSHVGIEPDQLNAALKKPIVGEVSRILHTLHYNQSNRVVTLAVQVQLLLCFCESLLLLIVSYVLHVAVLLQWCVNAAQAVGSTLQSSCSYSVSQVVAVHAYVTIVLLCITHALTSTQYLSCARRQQQRLKQHMVTGSL